MKLINGKGIDAYHLKMIAIIAMIIDHGYILFYANIQDALSMILPINSVALCLSILFGFTRVAFSIFAYLVAQGVQYTSNRWDYLKRLLLFACISEIPFQWFNCLINGESLSLHFAFTNVLFTLFLGALSIVLYDIIKEKTKYQYFAFLPVVIFAILATLLKMDYLGYGAFAIFLFYFMKDDDRKFKMFIILITLFMLVYIPLKVGSINISYVINSLFMCASVIVLKQYNGARGKKMKYFFYLFYPVHILILILIYQFII